MNPDLTVWLDDELGLKQMSESDLNSLVYHPRHGSLCRRLIRFLSESTLCRQRYPNVYATEEYAEASEELEKTNNDRLKVLKNLELYAKESENKERELVSIQAKLDILRAKDDLLQVSMTALREMVNRNNLGIEHLAYRIETCDYLSNSRLESLYSLPDMNEVISNVLPRQTTTIDQELREILMKLETMHRNINEILATINVKMNDIGNRESCLRKVNIRDLVALKKPEIEEITVYLDDDERGIHEENVQLVERVEQLDQQVVKLVDLHYAKKNELNRAYKDELEKYMGIVKNLQSVKNVIKNI